MAENQLRLEDHVLLCVEVNVAKDDLSEYNYLKSHFCGRVICIDDKNRSTLNHTPQTTNGLLYLCGDVGLFWDKRKNAVDHLRVIKEFSYNFQERADLKYASLGEVPMNLHNAAVYYRNILSRSPDSKDYFEVLQAKHQFQALTESTKPGTSFRKGIYLSEVETDGDASKFHLLRCSTNLSGPTLAFTVEDREILEQVNDLARRHFDQEPHLNHVLAQVYENSITVNEANKAKEHKAKIKSHSDKTKDMPTTAIIAFCTFYSSDISGYKASDHDRFDRCYKGASVLTQLRFKLKDEVSHMPLAKEFRVLLYPNSVLLIPLSTNRLYTHEIVPPKLPPNRFPTRLGYVVRCSKTKAVFRDSATYIQQEGKEDVKLEKPTLEDIHKLKLLYQKENLSTEKIEYGDVYFSLNDGDYQRPLVE